MPPPRTDKCAHVRRRSPHPRLRMDLNANLIGHRAVGQNNAASLPNRSGPSSVARDGSSSPNTSSPTSARSIASSIAGSVGTVSLRTSIICAMRLSTNRENVALRTWFPREHQPSAFASISCGIGGAPRRFIASSDIRPGKRRLPLVECSGDVQRQRRWDQSPYTARPDSRLVPDNEVAGSSYALRGCARNQTASTRIRRVSV